MYPIDLPTILRVFSHQSGELQADVKHIANIKGVCQASVTLASGKVVSCVISHAGNPVLSGEEALRTLVGKGTLEWEYIPSPVSPMSPVRFAPEQMSPARPVPEQMSPRLQAPAERAPYQRQMDESNSLPSMIPIQKQKVATEVSATWPRPYRFVYQLATGEKTVAEITQLLSLTPEQMQTILLSLIRKNFISLLPGR